MFKEVAAVINLVYAIREKLSTNQKKFIAEVIGTFIVIVFAIGSVVIYAKINGVLDIFSLHLLPL